jgi:uncharacterized protein YcbK (DUF882 family)
MQISPNFKRHEFACQCKCGYATADVALVQILEHVRRWAGAPVTVTSAARCRKHNKSVGGGEVSQHLLGTAADIVVRGKTPDEVAHFIDTNFGEFVGLGRYDTFTHVDVRGTREQWDMREKYYEQQKGE